MIIGNKYLFIEKLGQGNFGVVYKGLNRRTNELVAIKVEPINSLLKCLKNEAKIYQYLRNENGFLQIKWFEIDKINSYMVTDLLGINLTSYKKQNEKLNINLNNNIRPIGIQMIQRVKSLHDKSLIHRDIKPDNFLFGINEKKDLLYLIDLGFCKRYILDNNKHITNKYTQQIIGSPTFVSLNVHRLCQPSRRDDIESILYILLFLINKLNWDYLLVKDQYNNDKMIHLKENIIHNINIPAVIIELIGYCRKLNFDESPNYQYIIDNLNNL
jgi:casein kinase 1